MASVRWVPASALGNVQPAHDIGEGRRLASVREGFEYWLNGEGLPLPPIVVVVPERCDCMRPRGRYMGPERGVHHPPVRKSSGHHTCGQLRDGHHRLAIARELDLPLRVAYRFVGTAHERFGLPVETHASELVHGPVEKKLHTSNPAAAEAFRTQVLLCVERRQQNTGQEFDAAAQEMFGRSSELTPLDEVRALAWNLSRQGWVDRARHAAGLVSDTPSGQRLLLRSALTRITDVRDSLDSLIKALEASSAQPERKSTS